MSLLKSIPKIDKFIARKEFKELSCSLVTTLAREIVNELREDIVSQRITTFDEEDLVQKLLQRYEKLTKPSLQTLINATGIIVHTNLGRSPIDPDAFDRVKELVTNYNNLEFDLVSGKRGERYSLLSKSVCKLLGCEDMLIVNNNASAVFLILNSFAKKKEVVVSRGELVEIGGSFRVPDVMKQSGAKLKEVGTTNKTHLYDYEDAIGEKTAMLMKVHKSNYSIEGFSSEVEFRDIVKLAKQRDLIDYYDMGSGHLFDLPYGLDEPSVLDYMKLNPSLLSFSGDKLLGSVQAGIIVGKKEYIEKLKKNQLLRMLRVDKLTLALLEESFKAILLEKKEQIPTIRMLFRTTNELRADAAQVQSKLKENVKTKIIDTKTLIGGGTTPNKTIPSVALLVEVKGIKVKKLQKLFRDKGIIGRIEDDSFLLDFRAIEKSQIQDLVVAIDEISDV